MQEKVRLLFGKRKILVTEGLHQTMFLMYSKSGSAQHEGRNSYKPVKATLSNRKRNGQTNGPLGKAICLH